MVCIHSRSRNLNHHLAIPLDLNSRHLARKYLQTVTRMACQSSVSSFTGTSLTLSPFLSIAFDSNASLPRSNDLLILSSKKAFRVDIFLNGTKFDAWDHRSDLPVFERELLTICCQYSSRKVKTTPRHDGDSDQKNLPSPLLGFFDDQLCFREGLDWRNKKTVTTCGLAKSSE